jgi:uncharacterized protein YbjT (DUF2867 family)
VAGLTGVAAEGKALRALVTGASGYIGGRLVPELLAAGHHVRCLVRSPGKLPDHPWSGRAEIVAGDVTRADSVRAALEGVDVAYYLVHSMAAGPGFEEVDRRAARTFGEQARAAGVRRIVYLGGLTPAGVPEDALSPHLRSRAEVGRILLDSGVPTAVLRAAVIIGSGSASFEMLRYLTERLPVMVTPRWVATRSQPIAVRDVLRSLVGCALLPPDVNRTFDIGGPDVLVYRDMMQRYAAVAGLRRRLVVAVPVLSPRLSSLWVGLVTPVPGGVARPLVESLRHEVVCAEHDLARYVPDPPEGLLGVDGALRLALRRVRSAESTVRGPAGPLPSGPAVPAVSGTPGAAGAPAAPGGPGDPRDPDGPSGADGLTGPSAPSIPGDPAAPSDPLPTDPHWAGGSLYCDRRERAVNAPPEALWQVVEGIGGDNGWYSAPLAWAVRGWLDTLVGGVGLHRGRRDAKRLRTGDFLDFWRVEEIEPGRLLRLRAEMRLPGLAWLEMRVDRDAAGGTVYRQRALFQPRGLAGHAYWWGIAPFHAAVFGGMVRNIAAKAETSAPRG